MSRKRVGGQRCGAGMPSEAVRAISAGGWELGSCGEERLGCISRNHRVQLCLARLLFPGGAGKGWLPS